MFSRVPSVRQVFFIMPFLPTRGEASLITARFGKPASLFVGTHFWHGLTRQKQKAANHQPDQRGIFNPSLPPERPGQPPYPQLTFAPLSAIIKNAQVSQVCAPPALAVRKVRTPQSRKPGNPWRGASFWIGPQKHTARASVSG